MPRIDLTEKTFGRWTVIETLPNDNGRRAILKCRCECGTIRKVQKSSLINGLSKSCGCYKDESFKSRANVISTKHGLSKDRFYFIYKGMLSRCGNPKTNGYHNYGGRGIKVCDRWHEFENFKDDMYQSYLEHMDNHGDQGTSLDRIDVNGDYEPANCRWVTFKEQMRNKRRSNKNAPLS